MKDYRKILEGVVNIISTTEKSDTVSNICSYIDENCPELKESKDERIRKWLIEYFNDGIEILFNDDLKIGDILAWLEKQSGPKTEPTFLFKVKKDGKEYNVRGIFGDVTVEIEDKPGHFIYADLDDCEIIRGGYGIKESGSPYPTKLATFSEQEPVNPKFQPGDWVVCEDDCSVHQIKGCFENLNNHTYDYELTEGGHISSNDVNKWHLWVLEYDAKVGDILLVSTVTNEPFIYNGNFDDTHVDAYCGINRLGEFMTAYPPYFWAEKKDVRPATKEETKCLFNKMEEIGYEWDAENKKLNNKYSTMYSKIKNKINNLQTSVQELYVLTDDDKAFLNTVSDLLEENKDKNKKL